MYSLYPGLNSDPKSLFSMIRFDSWRSLFLSASFSCPDRDDRYCMVDWASSPNPRNDTISSCVSPSAPAAIRPKAIWVLSGEIRKDPPCRSWSLSSILAPSIFPERTYSVSDFVRSMSTLSSCRGSGSTLLQDTRHDASTQSAGNNLFFMIFKVCVSVM